MTRCSMISSWWSKSVIRNGVGIRIGIDSASGCVAKSCWRRSYWRCDWWSESRSSCSCLLLPFLLLLTFCSMLWPMKTLTIVTAIGCIPATKINGFFWTFSTPLFTFNLLQLFAKFFFQTKLQLFQRFFFLFNPRFSHFSAKKRKQSFIM